MNDDLISRQAAIKTLLDEGLITAAVYIERMPSADLFEYSDKLWETAYERGKAEAYPKKGKWRPLADGWAYCSVCVNLERAAGLRWRYCPNCGARMEE